MRLEGPRPNSSGGSEGFELNRLAEMSAKPLESANEVARHRCRAILASRSSHSGHRVTYGGPQIKSVALSRNVVRSRRFLNIAAEIE